MPIVGHLGLFCPPVVNEDLGKIRISSVNTNQELVHQTGLWPGNIHGVETRPSPPESGHCEGDDAAQTKIKSSPGWGSSVHWDIPSFSYHHLSLLSFSRSHRKHY